MIDLSDEINSILVEFNKDVQDLQGEIAEEVAKEAVEKLKQTSPKRRGKYAKGWAKRKNGNSYVIYNRTYPGLTHLLEHGHATRKPGKRVKAIVHIKPVEDFVIDEYPKRLKQEIEKL